MTHTRLHNECAPRGMKVFGIVIYYDNKDDALAMVNNRLIPYRVLLNRDKNATLTFRNEHYSSTTSLIAPDGSVVFRHYGKIYSNYIREQA